MTNRELFNTIRDHLIAQTVSSTDAEGNCAYRGGGGTKCAVGAVITDAAYNPIFEGCSMQDVFVERGRWGGTSTECYGEQPLNALAAALNASGIPATPATRLMLQRLQEFHDSRMPNCHGDAVEIAERLVNLETLNAVAWGL